MNSNIICLVVGLFVGAIAGVFLMSMLVSAGASDREMEKEKAEDE